MTHQESEQEQGLEILIGYVEKFDFNDKIAEDILLGHPKPGRIYQIVKDLRYGYRLHVGTENSKDNMMAGILLGESLEGNHDDKWDFQISIVKEDNFLDFQIHEEDAKKLQEWFATGNQKLKETLEQPVKIVTSKQTDEIKAHN